VTERRRLTLDVACALHARAITRFGGAEGIRGMKLLEDALSRARMLMTYGGGAGRGEATLFDVAGAYAWGIVRNHPFVDGNKRTAYLAGHTFLGLNGYDLDPPEVEIVTMMTAASAGSVDEAGLVRWITDFSRPLRRPVAARG
jgi:death-on-curing protein